jgi:SepF-like predicted cell division protein (DUF552 family)
MNYCQVKQAAAKVIEWCANPPWEANTDDQQITLTGNTLVLEDGGSVDLTAFLDNTDDQGISLSGNILTLEDGGTVDLSVFLDNTDDQTITAFSLSPAGVLTLTIEDGNTVTVDLSSLDTDTDDQTLSLAGTLLTIADGNTVDLAAIDTDDQIITNFSLTGTTLTLTIQDGNTVTVDLASIDTDTDTDDQTLSLAGSILTIADGNSVDLSSIDTDDQTLSTTTDPITGATTSITIADGNTVPIVHSPTTPGTLTTTSVTIYEEFYAGGANGDTAPVWSRNATVVRLSDGRWQVTFATPHPDGIDYHVSFGAEEPNTTRDNPKKTIEQGSKTANGFIMMLTVDDNGTGADPYNDQPWSFGVAAPVQVLQTAVLT